jgi:hypothetical protein
MTEDSAPEVVFATQEEKAAFVEEQVKEYGTYVAVAPITFNGVPAYNVGDPVPISNVEKHGYEKDGLVARIDSKAGQDMVRAIHESNQQAANQEQTVAQPVSLGVQLQDPDEQ